MVSEELVYFELNNWFEGRDYPADERFSLWVSTNQFSKNGWCKENKLCVLCGNIDMSLNWCITAPKQWVKDNCPKLLSEETYTYVVISYYKGEHTENKQQGSYSQFLRYPDEYGMVFGRFGWRFLEYMPENYGVTYCNDDGEIEDFPF